MRSQDEIEEQIKLHKKYLQDIGPYTTRPQSSPGQVRYDRALRLSAESIILALRWMLELEDSL